MLPYKSDCSCSSRESDVRHDTVGKPVVRARQHCVTVLCLVLALCATAVLGAVEVMPAVRQTRVRGVVPVAKSAAEGAAVIDSLLEQDAQANKLPFEAVFQGLCENSELCAQTCFNLHDGTFECNCHPGYSLDANGYSCSKLNDSSVEGSILYEKEASFVAVLDDSPEYQGDQPKYEPQLVADKYHMDYPQEYPKAYLPVFRDQYATSFQDKFPEIADAKELGQEFKIGDSYDDPYDSRFQVAFEEPRALPVQGAAPPGMAPADQHTEQKLKGDQELLDFETFRPSNTQKDYKLINNEDEGPEMFIEFQQDSREKDLLQSHGIGKDERDSINIVDSSVVDSSNNNVNLPSNMESGSSGLVTSPGPNLEQKVPSVQPALQATQSLLPQCSLDCGTGRCFMEPTAPASAGDGMAAVPRCQCPLGFQGPYCRPAPRIDTARFHGQSWVGFAPLREAYRDVQITIEFKPEIQNDQTNNDKASLGAKRTRLRFRKPSQENLDDEDKSDHGGLDYSEGRLSTPKEFGSLRGEGSGKGLDAVLLVSGENDDLSGDFMAAVIVDGIVEFRWDCGSGAGLVRSEEAVRVGEWNRLSVYRHRWDVWLQLNEGKHVQGRSEGLFSRITFREPMYVGGNYNLTSVRGRLGVSQGLRGCVRRLQVNDHVYQFYKAPQETNLASDYGALDGWDISECMGDACLDVQCDNGGQCVSAPPVPTTPPSSPPVVFTPSRPEAFCYCPLGYTGSLCQTKLNLEVPSFNGTSYLEFPGLTSSVLSWLELEVVFKSSAMDGTILYEGHRSDGSGDYIALTLSEAHVIFTIDLGSGSSTLRSLKPIRPGVWHTVHISRTGRRVWMYVNNQPPVEGTTPGGFTMLSLSQPLFLGGVPQGSPARVVLSKMPNFEGCIQKLAVGGRPFSLVSSATSGHNVGACNHPCSQKPCSNGGVCEPQGPTYACKCPLGFTDDHCRSRVVTQASTPSFGSRSFLKFTHPDIMKRVTGDKLHMWFRFRSTARNGLLVWIGEDNLADLNDPYLEEDLLSLSLGDCLSLEIKDAKLVLRYNLGSGFAVLNYNSNATFDDGEWHTVRLARFERQAQMTIDDGPELIAFSPGDFVQLNVDSALYIGGRETYHSMQSTQVTPGLSGCVADLTLATDYHVDLITMATAGQNIEYC